MKTKLNRDKEYLKAMKTFNKLMTHRLTVKTEIEKIQYIISYFEEDFDNCSSYCFAKKTSSFEKKVNFISPCFSTGEDCELAIREIDQYDLIHMFKTLKGIYENE